MFCPQCGKEAIEGQIFCPYCGARVSESPQEDGSGRTRTPWEERQLNGFFSGLFLTFKESLFSPTQFFRKMNVRGGVGDPLLYAMIVGVVGIMAFYVWQIVFHDAFRGYLPADMREAGGVNVFGGIGVAFVAMLLPFLVIACLFLWAGLLHLLLMMVRGANNGFEATFRAVAYSYGSCLLLAIPFCGGVIASVWNLILVIIGLKEAHGTSGGKASFAVMFPMILCCAATVLFFLLILGTVVASLGSMKPSPWR